MLTYATKWMNSEGIMLNEIKLSPKASTVSFHSYEVLEALRFTEKAPGYLPVAGNHRKWGVII